MERLLDFAILIKDKKSVNPVSVLSVVSDNSEAEKNILKAKSKLEGFVRQASGTETKVNVITTIDHNAASGITRCSREIMADIIVLGWPQRSGFLDKLFGVKIESILNNTDKTTLICFLEKPLELHKRIVLAVPPLAEHENGFGLWLTKFAKLAHELSIPIHAHCNEATEKSMKKFLNKQKLSASLNVSLFNDWDDFLVLARNIHADDFIVLVSARRGATSYTSILDGLPLKIEKHFSDNSRVIIYPQQYDGNINLENYSEVSTETLNRGIEVVQKIGKEIGSMLKKKNQE